MYRQKNIPTKYLKTLQDDYAHKMTKLRKMHIKMLLRI